MSSRLRSLLRNLFRRDRVDRDLDAEVSSYLGQLTEEKIAAGMSPQDARRAARLELGGADQVKENVRDARSGAFFGSFWQDIRFGARQLRRNPGFTAVAVLTLALGIGGTSTIFSVVNAVLLRPLPLFDADRLVFLRQSYPQRKLTVWWLSAANFMAYRDQNHVFDKLAGYSYASLTLTGEGDPERLLAARVTANFFDVLGAQPALGRTFLPGEDQPGSQPVCILSDALWQTRFGGAPDILGKKLLLDGASYEVVGVMHPAFRYPVSSSRLWVPLSLDRRKISPFYIRGVARLRPGVSAAQAQAETTALLRGIGRSDQNFIGSNAPAPPDADLQTVVIPLKESVVGDSRRPLLILLAAAGFVLLIACANVANLMLARATRRAREISLRFVLGASIVRVVRQLLTESLLLSLLGAAGGMLLALAGVRALSRLPVGGIPRITEVGLDAPVFLFAAVLALFTGVLFGLAPALRVRHLGLESQLREGARSGASHASRRMNSLLVVAQFALSLVLLVGAGLLLKSLDRLLAVNPGFDTQNLLSLRIEIPSQRYGQPAQSAQFYADLLSRARALPGVRAAGLTSSMPFTGDLELDGTIVEGHEPAPGGVVAMTDLYWISPGLFSAMRIPVLRGRDFLDTDVANSPRVAIVDDTLARLYWPDGNALGKRIRFAWDTGENRWMTIVGVVAGTKDITLALPMLPHLYIPHAQDPSPGMNLMVRADSDSTSVVPAIRADLRNADPDVPVSSLRTMQEQIDVTLRSQRLTNLLLGCFALTALLLAAVGIYGVVSLEVNSRLQEFGIRLALGAQRRDVFISVLRRAAALAAAGVVLGVLGAKALSDFLGNLLFEVRPGDPVILAEVVALLGVVALLACYLPARRATRVDSMVALRYE